MRMTSTLIEYLTIWIPQFSKMLFSQTNMIKAEEKWFQSTYSNSVLQRRTRCSTFTIKRIKLPSHLSHGKMRTMTMKRKSNRTFSRKWWWAISKTIRLMCFCSCILRALPFATAIIIWCLKGSSLRTQETKSLGQNCTVNLTINSRYLMSSGLFGRSGKTLNLKKKSSS